MSHIQRVSLGAFFLLAFAIAVSTNNETSPNQCYDIIDTYQRPNASSSESIPAVVQPLSSSPNTSADPLTSNTAQTWQIISAIGQTTDPYPGIHSPQLDSIIFLDTSSSSGPNSSPIPSVLAACSIVFTLPASDLGKASGDNDCTNLISEPCAAEIQSSVKALSESIAQSPSMDLTKACNSLGQSLDTLPNSCPKASSGDVVGFNAFSWQGVNLTYQLGDVENCSAPANFPIPLFTQTDPYTSGNFSKYDEDQRMITPVLLALFTNGTLFTGAPFADTRLVCTSPKNVAPDSHTPTSAADNLSKVDTTFSVGIALVVNALLFFML